LHHSPPKIRHINARDMPQRDVGMLRSNNKFAVPALMAVFCDWQ
jgi:hypothetical protein